MNQLHPAYLWVGSSNALEMHLNTFLKAALCKKGGCPACSDCKAIDENRHYSALRMVAENLYTVAHVETVLQTISLSLDPGRHFFIIFERAELFHHASAQRLLKSIEEPPVGYHFILMARRMHGILSTIRSRCLVEQFSASRQERPPLFDYFVAPSYAKSAEFALQLSRNKMTDSQIHDYLDALMQYWYEPLAGDHSAAGRAQKALQILEDARGLLPMSGSAHLFMKNLYLRLSLI